MKNTAGCADVPAGTPPVGLTDLAPGAGWSFVRHGPELLRRALAGCADTEVTAFLASWDGLEPDAYLHDGGAYRRRRLSTFRVVDGRLHRLPHTPFFQSTEVNRANGGVLRMFAPLDGPVATGEPLRALVLALLDQLPAGFDRSAAGCGVHQIRITATRDEQGQPTPEGMHRDGHHYVAQVLIRRSDVVGAESTLYDADGSLAHRTLLVEPFECIVLDDRRMLHSVSPITVAPDREVGVRDMMLVDFFPLPAPTGA